MKFKRINPEVTILSFYDIHKYWSEKGFPEEFELEEIEIEITTGGYFGVKVYGETLCAFGPGSYVIKDSDDILRVEETWYIVDNYIPVEDN